MKILFAGESWTVYQTDVKGFDALSQARLDMPGEIICNRFRSNGADVIYMPSHVAQYEFPDTVEELKQYDVVILSDIGSNTLYMHPDMYINSNPRPNRLMALRDYVKDGGALLMFGGYMSYSGTENKARYGMTPIAEAMPVEILNYDDRAEHPEGIRPVIVEKDHPVLKGISADWPCFLGYNKTIAKPGAKVIATIDGDPFMASMEYGKGRTFAFTTDCLPHWGTVEFTKWESYERLFMNMLDWLCGEK